MKRTIYTSILIIISVIYFGQVKFGHAQSNASASIEDAAQAVVRLVAMRCTNNGGCQPSNQGNGVLIASHGLIATTWHLTVVEANSDPSKPDRYADYFRVEMTNSLHSPPAFRYRAHVAAVLEEADMALLQIYATATDEPLSSNEQLPALRLMTQETDLSRIQIMGFSGINQNISYPNYVISGFDENSTAIKVQNRIEPTYLGAPALVREDDNFVVAGVFYGSKGANKEVGLIRRISELRQLVWANESRRVVGKRSEAFHLTDSLGELIRFDFDLGLFDLAGRRLQLIAYGFDAVTEQPYMVPEGYQYRSRSGQLAVQQEVIPTNVIESIENIRMTLLLEGSGKRASDLGFRVLVWDLDELRVLWVSPLWIQSKPLDQQVATATNEFNSVGSSTIDTPMPEATESTIETPTATASATPQTTATETIDVAQLAAVAAIQTAQAQRKEPGPPTPIAMTNTPTNIPPTNTPFTTPTLDVGEQVATAVAATFAAQKSMTPTADAAETATEEAYRLKSTVDAIARSQRLATIEWLATSTENARIATLVAVRSAQSTPTPPPVSTTRFFRGTIEKRCNGEAGNTWFDGKIFVNNQPVNGVKIVFKSRKVPGKDPATKPQISGPHDIWRDWPAGYYAHIVSNGFSQRSLEIWLIDDKGNAISEFVNWDTDGNAGPCNKAIINFYSP